MVRVYAPRRIMFEGVRRWRDLPLLYSLCTGKSSHRKRASRSLDGEPAMLVVGQNAHCISEPVGNREIRIAISVVIHGGDENRTLARRISRSRNPPILSLSSTVIVLSSSLATTRSG